MEFFDPSQSCRGMWKKWRRRVCPVFLDFYGVSERVGVSSAAGQGSETHPPKDHAELSQRATELKRMLTALLQKLTADR
jgi:hypothetical protein